MCPFLRKLHIFGFGGLYFALKAFGLQLFRWRIQLAMAIFAARDDEQQLELLRLMDMSHAARVARRSSWRGKRHDDLCRHDDSLVKRHAALCVWIQSQKKHVFPCSTWKHVVNYHFQHAADLSGPINVPGFVQLTKELDTGRSTATVAFPNSFEKGDEAFCGAAGVAINEDVAVEGAFKIVFLKLLLRDAFENYPTCKVNLNSRDWKISRRCFLTEIARVVAVDYLEIRRNPNPATLPLRARSLYQAPTDQETRNAEIVELLKVISCSVHGWFQLRSFSGLITTPSGEIAPWRELARLVTPYSLVQFLLDRTEVFDVVVLEEHNFSRCPERLCRFRCIGVGIGVGGPQPVALVRRQLDRWLASGATYRGPLPTNQPTGWEKLPSVSSGLTGVAISSISASTAISNASLQPQQQELPVAHSSPGQPVALAQPAPSSQVTPSGLCRGDCQGWYFTRRYTESSWWFSDNESSWWSAESWWFSDSDSSWWFSDEAWWCEPWWSSEGRW